MKVDYFKYDNCGSEGVSEAERKFLFLPEPRTLSS